MLMYGSFIKDWKSKSESKPMVLEPGQVTKILGRKKVHLKNIAIGKGFNQIRN